MNPKLIRRAMLTAIWAVAGSAAILSYSGIRALGLAAGFHPILSWLLPICVDGLVLAGALVVLDAEARHLPKAFGWVLTLIGVAASTLANVASADGWIAMATHAAPPLFLALTLEAWLHTLRSGVRIEQQVAQQAEEEAAEEARVEAEALAEEEAAQEKARLAAERALAKAEKATASKRPKVPAFSVPELQELRDGGLSYQRIADAKGLSKSRVMRALGAAA
jgi:signal transduction histidine kinase